MMGSMKQEDIDQLTRDLAGLPTVYYKKLTPEAKMPELGTPYAAGYDLFGVSSHDLRPGQRVVAKTGLAMAIPIGFEGRIRDRSGLAVKNGLHVLAGTIDADYRGEVGVVLINLSDDPNAIFPIRPGMKIAQILIKRCHDTKWVEVEELDATQRGAGGYGHTGT